VFTGYDYEGRKKELTARLRQACPPVEFLPVTANNTEDGRKILEADQEVDGYLVYMLGIWCGAPQVIAASGRPTLFVDDLYAGSGEFLVQYAAARRKGLRVAGVSSTRFEDVVQAVKSFECLKKLRSSVILDVLDREPGPGARAIEEVFGTKVQRISSDQLNEAYSKADRTAAQKAARLWIKGAKRIVEPSREEIGKSGIMYVAMQDLMRQNKAQALTIDCLRLFYGGKLPAHPCLGLFRKTAKGPRFVR
jgi:hypothetical protein